MKLSKQDFLALKDFEQEKFLSEGGTLVLSNDFKEQEESSTTSIPPSSKSEGSCDVSPSVPLVPFSSDKFDGVMINDPVELLVMLDEEVARGDVTLHKWQVQIMLDFASSGPTDKNPFQAIVRACNGSGKDKYVIAPCAVWLCMRYKLSIGVITSSSGVQLDNQTCRYIKFLAEAANRKFGFELWKINYRHYTCNFEEGIKSEIFCYATDEAGKAEGYHPTVSGAKMVIFVSEDKTVSDEINVALNKCTGYTHRVHVSTPGLPLGHFFDYCNIAVKRNEVKELAELKPIDWIEYHITAFDCSHLSVSYIEQMKRDLPGGENGSAYKSQVLAEFGTTDEMVVIPFTYIWRSINKPPVHVPSTVNDAGLDLSDGGAETVLVIRNGNKILTVIPFRFEDTQQTIKFLNEKFKEYHLDNEESRINGDSTGIGKPIMDSLKALGWRNIRYIDSRAKARRPKTYKNRATELFFNLRSLLEKNQIILVNDAQLTRQLSTRYYKINVDNVHQLLSKIEQRSRGYPSPDRADALNLAFWNYESNYVEEEQQAPYVEKEKEKIMGSLDLRDWSKGKGGKWISNYGIPKEKFSALQEAVDEYNRNKQLTKV